MFYSFPRILYALHQQGADAVRIYLAPFVDPFDPTSGSPAPRISLITSVA
jgi:hypothetical protein